MQKVIEVEHLRKAYGSLTAVQDVSFDVIEGEIFGLLGPNGAGKTTAVECLQGLRRPDGGSISVLGFDPRLEAQALRRSIGSQLQESSLPDRIKVWEALDLFASIGGHVLDWRPTMEQWGLADKRNATFASLSGGQRQRLFVALALVNNPRLVFLDEMTTGLDPAARRAAWDLIRAIRERGTTVVLVTHFMDEAEQLCDRVAIVDRGRVAAIDTPQGLGLILFFVMMMLAIAGPPREVLTDAMRLIADLEPLRYVIILLQDPWLGYGWPLESSLVVVGVMVVATLVSLRCFRWQ